MTRSRLARTAAAVLATAVAIGAAACARKPLPEQGSHAEQVYSNRCGRCHAPYQPGALTPAMWKVQVRMMQERMVRAGVRPLTASEREIILAYLTRHAGHD